MSNKEENNLGDMYDRVRQFTKGMNIQNQRGYTAVVIPDDHEDLVFPLLTHLPDGKATLEIQKGRTREPGGIHRFELIPEYDVRPNHVLDPNLKE